MRNYLLILILLVTMNGFSQHHGQSSKNDMHKVIVEEVIQTSNYTYLNVKENDKLQWVAVPKMEAQKGETYYYKGGMNMGEFTSKELNRTFDNIIFLGEIKSADHMKKKSDTTTHVAEVKVDLENIKVEALEDGITIAQLFENKTKYADKTVKIRAKVTKFTDKIMYRNWIHIQDGTNFHGNFDLTVTTSETAKVGDVIIIEGKVTLDKDFGYGYHYKVLLEEGKIIK